MSSFRGTAGWAPRMLSMFPLLMMAFLYLQRSPLDFAVCVSRHASRSHYSSLSAGSFGGGLFLSFPLSGAPRTPEPSSPGTVSRSPSQANSSTKLAGSSRLAFMRQLRPSNCVDCLSSTSRPDSPSPVSADAATSQEERPPHAAECSDGFFQPQKLGGSYCSSISSTQRLPTRTVVVGGGPGAAKAFDLLNGKPLAEQKQLLHQHQLSREDSQTQQGAQGLASPEGSVFIGSSHRVAVQTMANSDTRDVEATVQQVLRCSAAGADIVRLTVQGPREAEASRAIVARLREMGCNMPLVADIHFQPRVASLCADTFEKIRVNPGNFADGRKVWEDADTSQQNSPPAFEDNEDSAAKELSPEKVGSILGPWGSAEGLFSLLSASEREKFRDGHRRIEDAFFPLVEKCLQNKRALRIGTNHGSLSARILRHFGDTPMGMVLSAVEFADICVRAGFYNFVFSLKSSNPATMQQAYRLMAYLMATRGALFPLHLGVTEAGEGEDGRIKSAAGIGSLLQDGIGDTIRASLTEPPWAELPVCRFLRGMQEHKLHQADLQGEVEHASSASSIPPFTETTRNFAILEARGRLRLGRHPGTPTGAPRKQSQEARSILHRDGTAVVAIDFKDLLSPTSLFTALGLRVVGGLPFRTAMSADAVYLRSLFPKLPEASHQQTRKTQQKDVDKEAPTRDRADAHSQLQAARKTLLQLQQAGLTVWADAREIQQVQMTSEQLLQQLLQERANDIHQQQMLQRLDEACLYMPGFVAVQRLQDAAAVNPPLAMEYLKGTSGIAVVADGSETLEEFQVVVNRPNLLCVLVRPADRAATGVAAARRVSELLRQAERDQEAQGEKSALGTLAVIQWIEAPPTALLSAAHGQQKQQPPQDEENVISSQQAMTMFAAWEAGSLLLDRLANGVLIDAPRILSSGQQRKLALDLLQGCRMRSTKTEFISCPSCGRTLFDIQKVSAEIRRRTGHLPGVKIAVMGCIVNGIGEMGDADFGYVGGAPGLVDLYVGKKLVRRGVKSDQACTALIDVIKAEGRWKEPEEVDEAS